MNAGESKIKHLKLEVSDNYSCVYAYQNDLSDLERLYVMRFLLGWLERRTNNELTEKSASIELEMQVWQFGGYSIQPMHTDFDSQHALCAVDFLVTCLIETDFLFPKRISFLTKIWRKIWLPVNKLLDTKVKIN